MDSIFAVNGFFLKGVVFGMHYESFSILIIVYIFVS